MLEAVAFCHANNIVHRDLKPENLLLDANHHNSVKLIDFGTAVVMKPGKKLTEVFGTAYYISPDVLNKCYNEKSDIWSVGVIMHVLLSGRPPFEGTCDDEITKKVRVGTYDLNIEELSKVSKDAKDLLKRMLTYDQEDRISADEALRHPWIKKVQEVVKKEIVVEALTNLKGYNVEKKL